MRETLDHYLEVRRRRQATGKGIVGFIGAVTLHVGVVALVLFAPALFAEKPQVIDYVPVTLVPPPAQGRPEPPPPAPQQRPEPEPQPEPEPEKPEPDPETPVLPDAEPKEPEPEKEKPPPPQQTAPEPPRQEPPRKQGSPQGSPTSDLTNTAAVTVDNPDFTYGYYLDRLLGLVRTQWVRPSLGGEAEVTVSFRILSNGQVTGLKITRSSGYNAFDLAALRAVQSAAPLPPLPRSYREGSLGVNLIFR